ncbi:hypothetical protein HY489_04250 [Candidatus Woesearchaeota archaeon]|nr:hypothetical protein [Candidatus Woesearchaeota archaeon]
MNHLQAGSKRLADILAECDEWYHFDVSTASRSVRIRLMQDDEILFDGYELKKAKCARIAYDASLLFGSGRYNFNGTSVTAESVSKFCLGLEDWLEQRERGNPVSNDLRDANSLLDRIAKDAGIPQYMVASYLRLSAQFPIPAFEDLGSHIRAGKMNGLKTNLAFFKDELERGTDVRILNVEQLHPFVVKDGNIVACVFDPKMRVYQTTSPSAYDFRNVLRQHSADHRYL